MKRSIMILMAAFGLLLGFSTPAQAATTGNAVYNYGPNMAVGISIGNPMTSSNTFYPSYGGSVGRNAPYAQCLRPQYTMKSQWGALYVAGQVRCFTSNYNTLKLYMVQ